MNELMIALAKLAEAGMEYLEAKKVNTEEETARYKWYFEFDKAHGSNLHGPKRAPSVVDEAAAEPAAPKKEKKAKTPKDAPTAQPPAEAPKAPEAPAAPAAQPPADPLGDTGPVAGAFEGTANPPAPKAPEEKPAPEAAPKPMTKVESKDELIKTMGTFLQLNKSVVPGGDIEAIRAIIRGILVENFKVAKINDLTHPQRVEAITVFKSKIAGMGKK